ncbi:hypothetical protein RJT34_08529 [Clitoria ternatea]|uniref:Pentatricopeptide repeat-containing protein n=1 Tax=Clitoria ternatea TaxID=43366 RepID=A0AAN9K7U0_CLITE
MAMVPRFVGIASPWNKSLASWDALISSYAESGLCDEAYAVFLQMEKSNGCSSVKPNVISWSAVICGFANKGCGEESLELFRQMQLANVMTNCVTISTVLSVCAELAALNLGRELHGYAVRNGLINMYMKCGGFKEGHLVFDNIKRRDIISWNLLIGAYGMHELGENTLRTFDKMIRDGMKPDIITFIALLSACSHTGLVAGGQDLFDQMVKEFRIEPNVEYYACMVDLLGCAGLLKEASDFTSAVKVKDVSSINIQGTSATEKAIKFASSDAYPCERLYLEDIYLEPCFGGRTKSYCWRAHGSSQGFVNSRACFSSTNHFNTQPG